jgi:HlyD family secretion protein
LLAGVIVFGGILGKAKPIPPEKIVTAERGDIARSVVARGKIEPLSKVEVKSKANGITKALLVDVGDRVTEGQILAELDKEDLEAQVREAKATRDGEEANLHAAIAAEAKAKIEAANPELEFARRDFARAQELFNQKIASQQQLDDASRAFEVSKNRQQLLDATVQTAGAQVEQARARVAAAKAALDRAEETLRYATIRAPIAGLVLTRSTELGDAVSSILNMGSAATLIMTLGDVSSVYIKGEVDEADIGKAACGQHVRTKVEAYPTESFDGVVKRIAPMGKELNNVTTFEVRVSISNQQGKLLANMTANAEIVLEERKNVLLIPEAALVYDKDKNVSVQRLDPTVKLGWRKLPLKIGISNGQRAEVLEGLKESDKLVLP